MASFKISLNPIVKFYKRMVNPELARQLEVMENNKGLIALIAQGIADNFMKEGPGWAPLKASTIRGSVKKALKKRISKLSSRELVQYEDLARNSHKTKSEKRRFGKLVQKMGTKGSARGKVSRQILRKTNLLYKSATVPGAKGNYVKQEGRHLILGTNLVYAAIHNEGGNVKFPGTTNGFGRGIKIKAHDIPIPKREFMRLSEEWRLRVLSYIAKSTAAKIKKYLRSQR